MYYVPRTVLGTGVRKWNAQNSEIILAKSEFQQIRGGNSGDYKTDLESKPALITLRYSRRKKNVFSRIYSLKS